MKPSPRISKRARSATRRALVQALYQWQLCASDPHDVLDEFLGERDLRKADKDYFRRLLLGITAEADTLRRGFSDYLDRPLEELDPVEHAILLLGVYELSHCPEVPWRVVINECVELAKVYGAEQAYKYVNGILDRAARPLRPHEQASTG